MLRKKYMMLGLMFVSVAVYGCLLYTSDAADEL